MTDKEKVRWNIMHAALTTIWRRYKTPDQIRSSKAKYSFDDPEEEIAMAYENIQAEAENAVKGVRKQKK